MKRLLCLGIFSVDKFCTNEVLNANKGYCIFQFYHMVLLAYCLFMHWQWLLENRYSFANSYSEGDNFNIHILSIFSRRCHRKGEISKRRSPPSSIQKQIRLFYEHMRGSRNFHERGSNENGNEGGGSNPQKIPKLPFF